jgi:hypothetical protein
MATVSTRDWTHGQNIQFAANDTFFVHRDLSSRITTIERDCQKGRWVLFVDPLAPQNETLKVTEAFYFCKQFPCTPAQAADDFGLQAENREIFYEWIQKNPAVEITDYRYPVLRILRLITSISIVAIFGMTTFLAGKIWHQKTLDESTGYQYFTIGGNKLAEYINKKEEPLPRWISLEKST